MVEPYQILNHTFLLIKKETKVSKTILNKICGLRIKDIDLKGDTAGILFENDINIIIYNKYRLTGFSAEEQQKTLGKTVSSVEEKPDEILITLDNDWSILVDLRNEAYSGPEALQVCIPGEPIVIWN